MSACVCVLYECVGVDVCVSAYMYVDLAYRCILFFFYSVLFMSVYQLLVCIIVIIMNLLLKT